MCNVDAVTKADYRRKAMEIETIILVIFVGLGLAGIMIRFVRRRRRKTKQKK